ncbi:GNAT family N-acetyltransferase [Duganella sp. FT94W]|uniref:GNAT family N-acetyltransferase n=1 Tax=Duganella lactea TaxID=2692173 RepID=A0ABW9V2S7_9BURK|nr:GNAT family N-acetyltransferase [Duganella lactea]MYM33823.1 GNAT family N-acetyltransferase [Duganella lactea]
MHIEVRQAEYSERIIVRHMMELYQHDFSEFDGTDLDEHAQYGYYDLDCFWINPAYAAHVIKVDGKWAGFALVNDETYLPGSTRAMLEFFVLRKYRKHGVGRHAAQAILAMTPASWEIRVIAQNPAAATFWQTIAGPAVTTLDNDQWQGPVFTVDNVPRPDAA